MDVKAHLRFLRMLPRKVRLVVDAVRGLRATDAETRLQFIRRDASEPVLKLLRSAMANAKHNFKLDADKLTVKAITADQGPTLKRFRPRAMGRSAPIRKRTTHVTIVLTDGRAEASKAEAAPEKKAEAKASATKASAAKKAPAKKPAKA
jgi:large subunit ribosomal protein L22